MRIRTANVEEAEKLSDLAMRSKAYWGYSNIFMEIAKNDLTVSEENILLDNVYILEEETNIIGFFCLIINGIRNELDAIFIEPKYIGKGYGRLIWNGIIEKAKEKGIKEFFIIADPHAEGFYEKMGAIRIGDYCSTIFKNRVLPLLKVNIV